MVVDTIEDAHAFSFVIFEQGFEAVTHPPELVEVAWTNGGNLIGTFNGAGQWVNGIVPVEHAPFPHIPLGYQYAAVPAHPTLVLGVVNGEYCFYLRKFPVLIAMLYHKRYKPGMMVVHMDDVGLLGPCVQPVKHTDLKSSKTFVLVVVAIHFFAVE